VVTPREDGLIYRRDWIRKKMKIEYNKTDDGEHHLHCTNCSLHWSLPPWNNVTDVNTHRRMHRDHHLSGQVPTTFPWLKEGET
jgi:hypothetical protein